VGTGNGDLELDERAVGGGGDACTGSPGASKRPVEPPMLASPADTDADISEGRVRLGATEAEGNPEAVAVGLAIDPVAGMGERGLKLRLNPVYPLVCGDAPSGDDVLPPLGANPLGFLKPVVIPLSPTGANFKSPARWSERGVPQQVVGLAGPSRGEPAGLLKSGLYTVEDPAVSP